MTESVDERDRKEWQRQYKMREQRHIERIIGNDPLEKKDSWESHLIEYMYDWVEGMSIKNLCFKYPHSKKQIEEKWRFTAQGDDCNYLIKLVPWPTIGLDRNGELSEREKEIIKFVFGIPHSNNRPRRTKVDSSIKYAWAAYLCRRTQREVREYLDELNNQPRFA